MSFLITKNTTKSIVLLTLVSSTDMHDKIASLKETDRAIEAYWESDITGCFV